MIDDRLSVIDDNDDDDDDDDAIKIDDDVIKIWQVIIT